MAPFRVISQHVRWVWILTRPLQKVDFLCLKSNHSVVDLRGHCCSDLEINLLPRDQTDEGQSKKATPDHDVPPTIPIG